MFYSGTPFADLAAKIIMFHVKNKYFCSFFVAFDVNPTVLQTNPEVVALMQRYGVDVNYEQIFKN